MRNWKFESGIEVYEREFDGDLHEFKVYNGDDLLGTINPAIIEDMESIILDLNNGHDPVAETWEDGKGNTCCEEGWE